MKNLTIKAVVKTKIPISDFLDFLDEEEYTYDSKETLFKELKTVRVTKFLQTRLAEEVHDKVDLVEDMYEFFQDTVLELNSVRPMSRSEQQEANRKQIIDFLQQAAKELGMKLVEN